MGEENKTLALFPHEKLTLDTTSVQVRHHHTLTAAPWYSGLRNTPPNCRAVWCISARVSFLRSTERRAAHFGHQVCAARNNKEIRKVQGTTR